MVSFFYRYLRRVVKELPRPLLTDKVSLKLGRTIVCPSLNCTNSPMVTHAIALSTEMNDSKASATLFLLLSVRPLVPSRNTGPVRSINPYFGGAFTSLTYFCSFSELVQFVCSRCCAHQELQFAPSFASPATTQLTSGAQRSWRCPRNCACSQE